MNKKLKIVLLSVGLLVVLAYLFRGPEWPEEQISSNQLQILSSPEVDPFIALAERPWDEKLHEKILPQLKGWEKLPKFEDFPASEFSNNKEIFVDINSDPIGRIYRSAIRSDVEYFGINFAGKYSIADWGCGSGCQDGVIVDADTGHVYEMPVLTTNGHEARRDSRLLVQNPLAPGGGWMNDWYKMRYWEWTGKDFKLLGTYKVDLAKKEIIEVE